MSSLEATVLDDAAAQLGSFTVDWNAQPVGKRALHHVSRHVVLQVGWPFGVPMNLRSRAAARIGSHAYIGTGRYLSLAVSRVPSALASPPVARVLL